MPSSAAIRTFVAILGVLVAIKLAFLVFPPTFAARGQEAVFGWPMIAAIAGMGAIGLWLAPRVGFVDGWDPAVSNLQRFGIPAAAGLAYGLVTVVPKLFGAGTRLHPDAIQADIHVDFPLSLPFYLFGAVFLEVFLRLFATTTATWLLQWVLRGRWRDVAFSVAALGVSLYEPLPYLIENEDGLAVELFRALVGPLYLANVLSAWMLRRYGFLAPLTLRVVFYLVWHVIYGHWIEV